MSLIFGIVICIVIYVIFHVYDKREYYLLSWRLPGPLWLPIVGNAYKFICKDDDLFEVTTELCDSFPSPMRFWLGTKMVLVISDTPNAQKIMSSIKFATKSDLYKFLEPFVGKGLITSSGVKWKRDRKILAPLFLKSNSLQYFPSVLHHSLILKRILNNEVGAATFNIHPIIHRCVADFVNETIVGMKTNIQFGDHENLVSSMKSAYILSYCRMIKPWLRNDFMYRFSRYWRIHEKTVDYLKNYFKGALQEARKESNHYLHDTFIPIVNQMVEIEKQVPDFGTETELMDHLITLYAASEDTVAIISSFTSVLLGMYPNIQQKVVDEIHSVLGSEGRNIEEHDLEKFAYLDMVIKEVLRLFPVAPFIIRKTLEEFNLDGYMVPNGCSIIVSIHNIQRDKLHWERPNEFYPEHFLPEVIKQRHPYAYMPFSAGPRACVGKSFAYMALKIVLVTLLQSFKFETDGKLSDLKLKQDISVRFRDDNYPVRLLKR